MTREEAAQSIIGVAQKTFDRLASRREVPRDLERAFNLIAANSQHTGEIEILINLLSRYSDDISDEDEALVSEAIETLAA